MSGRLPGKSGALVLLLLLLWLGIGAHARAQDGITERAWWPEPCNSAADPPWSLARLPQSGFRPFSGLLAHGYGPCALWLRLQVAADPSDRVLRLLPSFVDRIELHDPARPDVVVAVTGDRQAADDQVYRSLALQLPLVGSLTDREVFLRLQSASSRLISVEALPLREAIDRDRLHELVCAAYLALLGVTLLVAVAHWQRGRDGLVGLFVFKQTMAIIWALLLLGFGRVLFGGVAAAPLFDVLTSLAVLGFTAAAAAFDRLLLLECNPPRWGPRLLLAGVAMLPVELLLMSMGLTWLALAINAAVATLVVVVMLISLILARPASGASVPALSRPQLIVLYGVIVLPVCASMLTQLGLLPGSALSLYGLLLHALLSGAVMLGMLTTRARRLRRRQVAAEAELLRTQALFQQEQRYRADREKLLDMLTHELKTPLAVMRMLLGTGVPSAGQVAQIQRSLGDINEVVERCAQAGQMEDRQLRVQAQPCNVRAELEALVGAAGQACLLNFEVDPSARIRGHGGGTVQTDPQLLRIILGNLIDNACKYNAADAPVSIRLAQDTADGVDWLLVDISNRPGAAGWPDAHRMFDKYYRSPGAQRQTGSGLGLYLTAGLAQLLGARVHYRPTATHVSFRLCLPR